MGIRQEIRLYEDEFVVMPNHFHGIVWIIDPVVGVDGIRPDGIRLDGEDEWGARGTGRGASLAPLQGSRPESRPKDEPTPQPGLQRAAQSLSSFMAGFKAAVTSRARRELNITGIWQRNSYEHIVRNEATWERIYEYMLNNPFRWQEGAYHPAAPPNKLNQDQ